MVVKRPANSAVKVRMFDPGTNWTLAEAREMLSNGYSVEQVVRLTGWPRPFVCAGAPKRP